MTNDDKIKVKVMYTISNSLTVRFCKKVNLIREIKKLMQDRDTSYYPDCDKSIVNK